jgi:phage FluMu protein Com
MEEKKTVGEKAIAIKCPCCGHRLFDLMTDTQGVIGIKCPRCKTVMAVRIMKKKISVVPSK